MTAIARYRYVAASCMDAQRWVAPGLLFVLSVAVTYVNGGSPLTTLAEGATWLFPITAWITVATLNDEDASQAAITSAAMGGVSRARLAKLTVAAAVGATMIVLSLVAAYATTASAFSFGDLAAGAVAQLLTVVGGVALGSLCARPVIARTGWAVLTIVLFSVVDLIVPDAPPIRIVLAALGADDTGRLWSLLIGAAGAVAVLAVVLIGVANRISRSRH